MYHVGKGCDNRKAVQAGGHGEYRKSLSLPPNYVMNLKLL